MYFFTSPVTYLGVAKIEITSEEGVCAPYMIFLVSSIMNLLSTSKTDFSDPHPPTIIQTVVIFLQIYSIQKIFHYDIMFKVCKAI